MRMVFLWEYSWFATYKPKSCSLPTDQLLMITLWVKSSALQFEIPAAASEDETVQPSSQVDSSPQIDTVPGGIQAVYLGGISKMNFWQATTIVLLLVV